MKKLFIITFIFTLSLLNFRTAESQTDEDEQAMINFIEDIIEYPAGMIETMSNHESINSFKIIKLFKNEEWRLINFTINISLIKCKNYKYDSTEILKMSRIYDNLIYLHYIMNKGEENQDVITFKFYEKGDKIIFSGIAKPID